MTNANTTESKYGTPGFNLDAWIFNKELDKKIKKVRNELAKADQGMRDSKSSVERLEKKLENADRYIGKQSLRDWDERKLAICKKSLKRCTTQVRNRTAKLERLVSQYKTARDVILKGKVVRKADEYTRPETVRTFVKEEIHGELDSFISNAKANGQSRSSAHKAWRTAGNKCSNARFKKEWEK